MVKQFAKQIDQEIDTRTFFCLKFRDIYLIGTFLDAKKDYRRANWKKSSILLLGNEKEGISEELKNICSEQIIIPMKGDADSLNVSISAGILLYEKIRSK